jgi:hypothetical protein
MVVRVKSFHTRCLFPAGPESARTKSPPQLARAAWGRSIARGIRSWGVTWLGSNVSNSVEPLGGTNEIRAHEMCLMTTPWILAAIRLRYNRRQRWLI